MKNIQYICMILALLVFTGGCSEDFLEKEPLAVESDVTFYSTPEGALMALNAVYDALTPYPETQLYAVHHWAMGSTATPDAETGGQAGGNDRIELQQIAKFQHSPDNVIFAEYWDWLYEGIYRANIVTTRVPDIEMEEGLKQRYIAEAKFLRALFYFDLVKVFKAVPVFDEPLGPSEYKQTRSPRIDAWELIEKDLKEAVPYLPQSYPETEYGRATWGAAKSLWAKACVFQASYKKNDPSFDPDNKISEQEKWQDALKHATDVINSGRYELIGINGETFNSNWSPETSGYKFIWTEPGEESDEIVFAVQSMADNLGWGSYNGNVGNVYQCPRQYLDESGEPTAGIGWGFNCPTMDFVNSMDPDDPRLKIAVGQNGDPVPYKVSGELFMGSLNNWESPTGNYHWKYFPHPLTEWPSAQSGPLDIKLIRYADVVLFAAEAALELGQQNDALEYINMVRKRARNSGDTGKPENLSSISLTDIQNERRWELCFEGHRFFDLVRWGIAAEENQRIGRKFVANKHEYFPIPTKEITLSGNLLEQNPGY